MEMKNVIRKNCHPCVYIQSLHPGVTGSCNLCTVKLPNKEEIRFIVDCGLFQEQDYETLNEKLSFDGSKFDFCFITHNHTDHTGRLPLLTKEKFEGKIYTSEGTSILLPCALEDSSKVMKFRAKAKLAAPLFEREDMLKTLEKVVPCKYNETIKINDYVKATFLINGHLVGASLILIQISYPDCEDINLLFTGDYNNKNMFFDVPEIPSWILDLPLTVIQESTYGYMDSNETFKCFENNVLETLSKNGRVLTLVFSLGRAQEILYTLKCMQDDGRLDTSIPIYYDGKLSFKYSMLYASRKLYIDNKMRNFFPTNLTWVSSEDRQEVIANREPKIIVTTSGMGSYGPATAYLPAFIPECNTLIQFSGYTAEGSLGYRLKETETDEPVLACGLMLKKRARVEYTTEYSAHAKADEIIEFLKKFNNLKMVLVNHGKPEVKEEFATRIMEEVKPKNVGILGDGYVFMLSCYGFEKTIRAHFTE